MPDLKSAPDALQSNLQKLFHHKEMAERATISIRKLPLNHQSYVSNWVTSIARTFPEIAYQFALNAGQVLDPIDQQGAEQWIQRAQDVLLSDGLYAALKILKSPGNFVQTYQKEQHGIALSDIKNLLRGFVNGLGGSFLAIRISKYIYTDSAAIYLPERVDQFNTKADNFAFYKILTAYLWAQNHYGTWRKPLPVWVVEHGDSLARFHYLETLRLNACIKRDLPGLYRQMQQLEQRCNSQDEHYALWQKHIVAELQQHELLSILRDVADLPLPIPFCYQGSLKFGEIDKVRNQRIANEKQQLQQRLAEIANTLGKQNQSQHQTDAETGHQNHPIFKLVRPESNRVAQSRLALDGYIVPADAELDHLLESIIQDLGEIPPEYLQVNTSAQSPKHLSHQDIKTDHSLTGIHLYDEWDFRRRAHRKHWCRLHEKAIEADYRSDFVSQTRFKYHRHIKSLRRSFEMLRDNHKHLKRQPDGDDLDIDALVDATADLRSGMEMSAHIYRKPFRLERNIAVVFLIDMSDSTRGWINLAQREALVLLSDALQSLNDSYAIYGFSGTGRRRCDLYRIKSFEEVYSRETEARISGIEPQGFTRMGVTIRHLTKMLESVDARTKILITLSDGKPDDIDGYQGEYGVEDTRQALLESRQKSIHPFCITIDEQARDYLPHMYGESNYVLVDDAEKLPYRISEIYRGLTS